VQIALSEVPTLTKLDKENVAKYATKTRNAFQMANFRENRAIFDEEVKAHISFLWRTHRPDDSRDWKDATQVPFEDFVYFLRNVVAEALTDTEVRQWRNDLDKRCSEPLYVLPGGHIVLTERLSKMQLLFDKIEKAEGAMPKDEQRKLRDKLMNNLVAKATARAEPNKEGTRKLKIKIQQEKPQFFNELLTAIGKVAMQVSAGH